MNHRKKEEVITFKVDQALSSALHGIENRSAFIRQAVLTALEATCPLCMGTGILTKKQLDHWTAFEQTHAVEECPDCHAVHLVCGLHDQGEKG
ncbi:ribbon-helix-helix domain-containing protein [bacterium]|nr:ribbon-helix-helix domain-containing protein [bacterium]MBU1651203.1 ribbon-helix-helix domain-containing protein [bacterium]